jgi:hypothetical protein
MRRLWCVGVILLLGFGFKAERADAQTQSGSRDRGSRLEQNYPNPFNPTTTIPFVLLEEDFPGGRPAIVTIRIFNILRQPVAIPVAKDHPSGGAPLVERLEYPPERVGLNEAYWDGLDRNGRKVSSGLYLIQLEINGVRQGTKSMTVSK